VTLEQLEKVASDFAAKDPFCRKNRVKITDSQIEALVRVLDLDENGQLD
jgi:hypothetical protein